MFKFTLNKYYGAHRAAKAIYGIILISVLLLALEHSGGDFNEIFVKLFVGSITIVFAEIFSEFLGETISKQGKLSLEDKKEIFSDNFAITSIAFIPITVFLLSLLGLYSIEVAFTISFILLLVVLALFAFVALKTIGYKSILAIIITIVFVVFGITIMLLKFHFAE